MTAPSATAATPAGVLRALPRGARLDEAAFAARHRVLWRLLLGHLPVLAVMAVVRDVGGPLVWGQLAAVAGLLLVGRLLESQVARASAVGSGSWCAPTARARRRWPDRPAHLVLRAARPGGALPAVDAVPAGGRLRRGAPRHDEPAGCRTMVFSTPRRPGAPAGLRAAARGLPAGRGDVPRLRVEVHRGGRPRPPAPSSSGPRSSAAAQAQARRELAEERARAADEAAAALRARRGPARRPARSRIAELSTPAGAWTSNVATATSVMEGLRDRRSTEIAAAASRASTTAQEASELPATAPSTVGPAHGDDGGDRPDRRQHLRRSPTRPTCWRSTPRSRRPAPARPARASPSSPGRSRTWRARPREATERIRRVVDAVRGDVDAAGEALAACSRSSRASSRPRPRSRPRSASRAPPPRRRRRRSSAPRRRPPDAADLHGLLAG